MSTLIYFGSMKVGMPNGPGVNEYDFLCDLSSQNHFDSTVAYCPITEAAYQKLSKNIRIVKTIRTPIVREFYSITKFFFDFLIRRVSPSVVIIRLGKLPIMYWFLVIFLHKLHIPVHVKTVGVGTANKGKHFSFIEALSFKITEKVLKNCASLDTPTEYAKNRIRDAFGVRAAKIIVVNNGSAIFDVPRAREENGRNLTLGYVGRFPFIRGGKQVIQVLSQCRAAGIHANAIITGSLDEVAPLKDLAFSLNVDNFIDFIGLVEKEEIPYILTKIDYGFSIVEGIKGTAGQKLRQYLMAGCRVVYQNDEFFELIDKSFIHQFKTDINAFQFICNGLNHNERSSREDIRKWAIENISYSKMNEHRMQHLMRLKVSRGK